MDHTRLRSINQLFHLSISYFTNATHCLSSVNMYSNRLVWITGGLLSTLRRLGYEHDSEDEGLKTRDFRLYFVHVCILCEYKG